MYVLITAYERKMAGRDRDARRAARKGVKVRVYKPRTTRDDRWEG